MLEFVHTNLFRGNRAILSDVTFSLPAGEMTVLIGRNGCGKSTLLSTLTGESRYTGSILLDSTELSRMSAQSRAQRAALLPQSLLAPHMTVEELVRLGRLPHLSLTSRQDSSDALAVAQALSDVEMDAFRDRYLDEISGGERQKAYLAMILSQETPLLLLDEPTTYMDLAVSYQFMELLSRLRRERQKTVLVAMHDLGLAMRYADRVALLHDGGLLFFGTVSECLASEVIERVFHVRRIEADGQILFVG